MTRCVMCGMPTHQRCSNCKSVYYCSLQCQQEDWEYHASEECNDVPLPMLDQDPQFIESSIAFIQGPVGLDADEEAARQQRLGENVLRLYHQTNSKAADSIVASQEFRLGSVGYAGAGIYFAVTPEDTDLKAHEKVCCVITKEFFACVYTILFHLGCHSGCDRQAGRGVQFGQVRQGNYGSGASRVGIRFRVPQAPDGTRVRGLLFRPSDGHFPVRAAWERQTHQKARTALQGRGN